MSTTQADFKTACERRGLTPSQDLFNFWQDARLAAPVAAAVPQGGIWVGTISSGDIEGDEIDWDAEFDRKVVDALPQLRVPNQHFSLFMAPLNAAQPPADAAPSKVAQGDELSQQAAVAPADGRDFLEEWLKTSRDISVVEYAYQQGRAAGLEEAAQVGMLKATNGIEVSAAIRALNK